MLIQNRSSSKPRLAGLILVAGSWILTMTLAPPLRAEGDAETIPTLFEHHAAALSLSRPAVPDNSERLQNYRDTLLRRHAEALGVRLSHVSSPVKSKVLDTIRREKYTLRKMVFYSQPRVPIPAHLYIPENLEDPAPAVLNVHGHWPQAKNAVQVHARCVFLASRGFVVLSLDAMGAGERAYQGISYHGRQLGYQVLPTGRTLAGLQVHENRRAVDFLSSLPEVDPNRIGVTGASGGGNQTFHLSILDPRIKAAVAVCFFGSYCGYLRGAHCACELAPGALTYAEEGNLAGLVAPRPLMIIAAEKDSGAAFRFPDAARQASLTSKIYGLADAPEAFRFVPFPGGHDYSAAMRETMVGFFEEHLMDKGNGSPVPERDLDLLGEEELTVVSNAGLMKNARFVPHIVSRHVSERVKRFEAAGKDWGHPSDREVLRNKLIDVVFGGFPTDSPLVGITVPGTTNKVSLSTEPGVEISLERIDSASMAKPSTKAVVILGPVSATAEFGSSDWDLYSLHPRGTGATAWPVANTVRCEDYLLAQGSNILGRPMMGQQVWDALRASEYLRRDKGIEEIAYFGAEAMGLVAILAGVLDDHCEGVGAVDFLASYNWPDRFDDRWGLITFVPGILKVGDIPHIALGLSPGVFVVGSPRRGDGEIIEGDKRDTFLDRLKGDKNPPRITLDPEASAEGTLNRLLEKLP